MRQYVTHEDDESDIGFQWDILGVKYRWYFHLLLQKYPLDKEVHMQQDLQWKIMTKTEERINFDNCYNFLDNCKRWLQVTSMEIAKSNGPFIVLCLKKSIILQHASRMFLIH